MIKVAGHTLVLLLVISIALAGELRAQEKYPTRAIQVIVPFSPGGSTDLATRATAAYLNKKWGVPVNVINKPGGNTIPGQLEVYQSAPDGYTIMGDGLPMCSLLEVVVKDLPFKVMDRTFVAITSFSPQLVITPEDSPYKTLQDLIDEAKKDPANFAWDSLGGVSGDDFGARMFFRAAGVDVHKTKPVMSKGGSEGARLVAGGHIKLSVSTITTSLPYMDSKTVRPLGVCYSERDAAIPNVPTTTELGYPTIYLPFWQGISGPPKMPDYIVETWSKALQEMVKDPEYIDALSKLSLRPFYHNPKDMMEYIKKERATAEDLYQ